MIIFDFYFYTIYRFLSKKLRRGKEDAKHSALSILVVYISLTIDLIACFIGLINDNYISRWLLDNDFSVFIFNAIISYMIFRKRYYTIYDVDNVELKILNLPENKRSLLKYITYSILIFVPILGFVFYRMYR
jgi:hypothetical protein